MAAPLHPDFERVQAALRHEPDAREWLTRQLRAAPRLLGRVAARTGGWSAHELDDAANEAVCTALRRLDSYHGLVSFVAWLHRICIWTLRGQLRRRQQRRARPLDFDVADTATDPGATAARREQDAILREHLDAIGGVEADVLRLRFLDGLDFGDIAARQGIPLATVRTRYYRALKKLQQRLRPGPPDAPDSR